MFYHNKYNKTESTESTERMQKEENMIKPTQEKIHHQRQVLRMLGMVRSYK